MCILSSMKPGALRAGIWHSSPHPPFACEDAAAVLARRDELQEEDPPIEALRVWVSMRELRRLGCGMSSRSCGMV